MNNEIYGLMATNARINIPLIGIHAQATITGRLAKTTLSQRFRNPAKKPIEAVYAFPLPEAATLTGFEIERDGKRFVGKVKEKEAAFAEYSKSIEKGDGAYLLDQERDNLFRLSVGNLPPNGEVTVSISYVHLLDHDRDALSYVLPTAIAERYVPAHQEWEPDGRPTDAVVNPPRAASVPYGIKIDLEIRHPNGLKTVSCNRPIQLDFASDPVHVSLSSEKELPNGDIVFSIVPKTPATPTAVQVTTPALGSFLHIDWPTQPARNGATASHYLFLIDCSGSMMGERIAQAKRAVAACIAALEPQDHFAICRFGSQFEALFGFVPVTDANLEQARRQIVGIDADLGGTEMGGALANAYDLFAAIHAREEPGKLIMITDGEVSNEAEIFNLVTSRREAANLFVAAIGEAPNDHLGKGCARAGNGECIFIRPGEPIEQKMIALFDATRNLSIDNLQIKLPEGWEFATASVRPYSGQTVSLFARSATPAGLKKLAIHWELAGKAQKASLNVLSLESADSALPQLWAKERIRAIEDGSEPFHGSGQQRTAIPQLKNTLQLALDFGIASQQASFILHEVRKTKTDSGTMEIVLVPGLATRDEMLQDREQCCASFSPRQMSMPSSKNVNRRMSQHAVNFNLCLAEAYDVPASRYPIADPVFAILALQKARGGFDWKAVAICGMDEQKIKKAWAKAAPQMPATCSWDEETFLATALVLAWLEHYHADRRAEWEPLLRKTLGAYQACQAADGTIPVVVGKLPFATWLKKWL
jgi:Ca-activated chloride channel family protein